MAAVKIEKKDVEKLGKDLLKEVFDFFHDEYIMKNFLEMKLQKFQTKVSKIPYL